MDTATRELIEQTKSPDDKIRLNAFTTLLTLTENPVDWAYDAWNDLTARLTDPNSYQRTIALLMLCNLAQSDPQGRIAEILPDILAHTSDEKFITSRQCIQACWKIAVYRPASREAVVNHLTNRFMECKNEKHANLLRLDLIQSLRKIDRGGDLKRLIDGLIASETNEKYRAAYSKQ